MRFDQAQHSGINPHYFLQLAIMLAFGYLFGVHEIQVFNLGPDAFDSVFNALDCLCNCIHGKSGDEPKIVICGQCVVAQFQGENINQIHTAMGSVNFTRVRVGRSLSGKRNYLFDCVE